MKFEIEEILSLIELLLDDKINNITVKEGRRGLRGKSGRDGEDGKKGADGANFSFEENQERIKQLLLDNKKSFKGEKGTAGTKGAKGAKGANGKDGVSFDWDKYKDLIYDRIDKSTLKFTDLSESEIKLLKGDRGLRGLRGLNGRDGVDGKDFIFDEHKEVILSEIEKHSLTFEKLTDENKLELRGPRGLRGQKGRSGEDGLNGKDGKDFIYDEHKEKILEHLNTLKLKFSDLTDIEKNDLRGPQGFRGQRGRRGIDGDKGEKGNTGVPGLRGLNGLNGKNGINGRDGEDGKDAPTIIDIQLREENNTMYFVFFFDNGHRIETKRIDKPIISQMVQQTIQSIVSKEKIPVSDEGIEVESDLKSLNFVGTLVDATSDSNGNVTVTVNEPDTSSIVLKNVDCDSTVYVGSFVRMNASEIAVNALADSLSNSNVLGLVVSKSTSILCDIRVTGVSEEVLSGLDVTKEYFLSDTVSGGIATTIPTASGHVKLKLGQPFSDKKFLMLKGERQVRL